MDRMLKATVRVFEGRRIGVLIYEVAAGVRRPRYHALLQLGHEDAVVLDASSLDRLETLIETTLPAAHWSRHLLASAA
jgi:hypothetical protein